MPPATGTCLPQTAAFWTVLFFLTLAILTTIPQFSFAQSPSSGVSTRSGHNSKPNRSSVDYTPVRPVNLSALETPGIKAYTCAGLCAYDCIAVQRKNATTCLSDCNKNYNKADLCDSNDESCWQFCNSLLTTPIITSSFNATNFTARSLEDGPKLVDLSWAPETDAVAYLVIWRSGASDNNKDEWMPSKTIISSAQTKFRFQKETICKWYRFSVGVIRSPTKVEWSESHVSTKPLPGLSDPSLAAKQITDMRNTTEGVEVFIEYARPKGWDAQDILVKLNPIKLLHCVGDGFPPPKQEFIVGQDGPIKLTFSHAHLEHECTPCLSIATLTLKCDHQNASRSSVYDYPNPDECLPIHLKCGAVRGCSESTDSKHKKDQQHAHCINITSECSKRLMNVTVWKQNLEADEESANCSTGDVQLYVNWTAAPNFYPPIQNGSSALILANQTYGKQRRQRLNNSTPAHETPYCPVLRYALNYGYLIQHTKMVPSETKVQPFQKNINEYTFGPMTFADIGPIYYVIVCAIYDSQLDDVPWITDTAETGDEVVVKYPSNDYCKRELQLSATAHNSASSEERSKTNKRVITVAIAVPFVLVILTIVGLVSGCWYLKRMHRIHIAKVSTDASLCDPSRNDYLSIKPSAVTEENKWELSRDRLFVFDFEKPLGAGAFGKVYKGKIMGKPRLNRDDSVSHPMPASKEYEMLHKYVAVKQCFEYADAAAKSDFRQEIELMQNLGYHPHLVNMLYRITETEPLSLIVEYCENGDLRHYLRDVRNYMIQLDRLGINLESYNGGLEEVDEGRVLSLRDVILFSFQVSDGLEYLHQKGYIHRDIAARNILVDQAKRCKIGDFGLCRFVTGNPVYMSKGGKLPIKWMSLEALKEFRYTKENDMWSFGVLLFEIVTLGGTPYPDVMPLDGNFQKAMIAYLESGKRMECPDNCPSNLYKVMKACWSKDPGQRPSISDARERLRSFIETLSKEEDDIYLDPNKDYYNVADLDLADDDAAESSHASSLKSEVNSNRLPPEFEADWVKRQHDGISLQNSDRPNSSHAGVSANTSNQYTESNTCDSNGSQGPHTPNHIDYFQSVILPRNINRSKTPSLAGGSRPSSSYSKHQPYVSPQTSAPTTTTAVVSPQSTSPKIGPNPNRRRQGSLARQNAATFDGGASDSPPPSSLTGPRNSLGTIAAIGDSMELQDLTGSELAQPHFSSDGQVQKPGLPHKSRFQVERVDSRTGIAEKKDESETRDANNNKQERHNPHATLNGKLVLMQAPAGRRKPSERSGQEIISIPRQTSL